MKITRLSTPTEIIGLDDIAEYIGMDSDLDLEQNKILPVLRQAAIELGEQITGIMWGEADYQIDMQHTFSPVIAMPLSPVRSFTELSCDGIVVDKTAYAFTSANPEVAHFWANIKALSQWPAGETFTIKCKAGWTAETLPDVLRMWALIRISTLYDTRADVIIGRLTVDTPRDHARALLDRYTVRNNPYVFG